MAKFIDNGIEKFASYLRDRNNLDHITYLKVRLGMQTVMINLTKMIVTYGVSLLLGIFLYTLTVHLTFLILRFNAHGAHAKKPIYCHIFNLILFIFLPWLVTLLKSDYIMLALALLGVALLIKYSPGITEKQPIPKKFHKKKKILAVITAIILIVISFFLNKPFSGLIYYGIFIIGILQLPIFFKKEEL
ncbi:accessory gene regulator AgrB [Staphylococcus pettenkoferi]|uniref:accessory gene regulator AgrB n=1 Tax=Staphylococcus pettenkoferi TaxID=170573 RepID=UPI0011A19402|nr:accessory gene regulator AgrB [Staphylococcus pettenkoferi]MCY1590943.1 accessory gene regulator AgrB [Staphylococcus pettenkoferi]MCY1599436.1 accessory gene regulator AgrB [Staphylococcus pettenkoferi]MCY1602364.1 accessory gene regulator AgrB [Staphylococcus pettenkoferi]MCY1608738.1 accessory gene regulator AgrB [Staphylococcus pettenkoferi]MCY1612177.1 accessory gene regulator AgrB [Staphylococcus pettenkoferi]